MTQAEVFRRAVRTSVLVLAVTCAGACAEGSAPEQETLTRSPSGISKEEYCSSSGAMVRDVSAARGTSGVVVSWRDIYATYDPITYRIYRRVETSASWARIAQIELAQTSARDYADPAPPATRADYAITLVGECGESPICSRVNVGEQCSVASIEPLAPHG
jgi:hypothetical protein